MRPGHWLLIGAGFMLACATSPESPDPGVLKLFVKGESEQFSSEQGDTLWLRFWNERAYRDDGMWADIFDALEGDLANRNIATDTVEVISAASIDPGARIGLSHLPPASYDSLALSIDHLGYFVQEGTTIPLSSALEERRTVVAHRFNIHEQDTLELVLICHVDSSLERHGDEFKFTPVFSVE